MNDMENIRFKHTPGPWRKCHANNDECPCGLIWDNTGQFVLASVTSSCKEHESSNLQEGLIRGSLEYLANVSLIAAAPEMLIEILKLVSKLDAQGFASIDTESLIMKATGWKYAELNNVLTRMGNGEKVEDILAQ